MEGFHGEMGFDKWEFVLAHVLLPSCEEPVQFWALLCKIQTYWSESSAGPQCCIRNWIVFHMRQGWENWNCSAWRREGSGDFISRYKYIMGGRKSRVFSLVPNNETRRKSEQIRAHEIPFQHKKMLFPCARVKH